METIQASNPSPGSTTGISSRSRTPELMGVFLTRGTLDGAVIKKL